MLHKMRKIRKPILLFLYDCQGLIIMKQTTMDKYCTFEPMAIECKIQGNMKSKTVFIALISNNIFIVAVYYIRAFVREDDFK